MMVADPAVEQGRADGDEPAGPGIGLQLEGVPDQDTAHAVPDDMNCRPFGLLDEFLEQEHVFVQALEHRLVLEEARAVTKLAEAMAQRVHLLAIDHRAVDENDGGRRRRGRPPLRVQPGGGHVTKIGRLPATAIRILGLGATDIPFL
jgi:hypothetical protein